MAMAEEMDTEVWVEDFLTDLINSTGLDVFVEELSIDDEDVLHVQMGGPDSARVIGRDGQVLDAIQHLVIAAAIHAGANKQRILVDVEQYRKRREYRLRDEAERLAEDVIRTGIPEDMQPMAPRERRLVHMALAEMKGVETESFGSGDERYVRIVPVQD